jgi:hypothetical protein
MLWRKTLSALHLPVPGPWPTSAIHPAQPCKRKPTRALRPVRDGWAALDPHPSAWRFFPPCQDRPRFPSSSPGEFRGWHLSGLRRTVATIDFNSRADVTNRPHQS